MSDTFTEHDVQTLPLTRGSELRVTVVGYEPKGETRDHYAVSVRQWITVSNAELYGVVAGNGRTRSTYTGPDGRHGLSNLTPSQCLEVAENLTRAAIKAQALEDTSERV